MRMKADVTLTVDGKHSCTYEVIVPETDEPEQERAAHAQRVIQAAVELGLSLLDAPFKVSGRSALKGR
jgi:hypothetical protein